MHGSLMFEYHYIMNCIGCRRNSLTEYSYGNLSLDIAIDHEQLLFLHVNERKKRNKRPETNNRARTIIIGKINGVCCNLNTRTENCFRSSSQGLILMLCIRFHTHFQSFAMEKWTKFINKVIFIVKKITIPNAIHLIRVFFPLSYDLILPITLYFPCFSTLKQ